MARSRKTSRDPDLRRWLLTGMLVALGLALLAFAGYLLRLDAEVQREFAAVRWVLPAQVYAAPLEIYPGAPLSIGDLRRELDRLGYREASELLGPGTYVAARNDLRIDTRRFAFWDGVQEENRIEVRGDAQGIGTIRVLGSTQTLDLVRLDPLLIGSIYPSHGGEDRVLVRLNEVPPLLPQTVILVEDRNFYRHIGVSLRGILRAALANLRAGHTVQGASTITQQLVRNFFLTPAQTLHRKLREALMAILLERHVSKNEILEAYLNEVALGQDGPRAIHGFGLASHFYFNKPLNELQPHEIATLVAIVKGPSYYNPRRYPQRVLERRNLILKMMADAGLLRADQYQREVAEPLGVSRGGSGGAVRYPAFVDLVRRQLAGLYPEEALTSEGLRIFTTLDPRVQSDLENRIQTDLPEIEKAHRMAPGTLEGAGVVTSVEGGEVLAVVGGRDVGYAGFNRAIDTRRPIGSLAKPFLYLSALEQPQQYTLDTPLDDQPVALKLPNGRVWEPKNYDRQLHGQMPLYQALAHSYNLPTVRLGLNVGVDRVRDTFARAGFDDVPAVPSIFLGAIDMSPLDVAQIYSTLAAGGFRTPLLAIRAVLTQEGKPLSRYPFKIERTLPEGPVYLTTWAMEQVIAQGTARWASSVLPPGQVYAGKTGTTEDFRDSWFAGFGADRVAAIWVGRDDNKPTGLEGATGALRIWARLMRDLHARGLDPTPPADVEDALIDPASGLLADAGCADAQALPFLRGSAPQQYAPCADAAQSSSPLNWFEKLFKK
ncbi:MAG: penicillin-binding protein 1B [Sinobacteraceae bacterium]|nr:penicillin-binding protein 1B [Nevskiaceae bacterium]